MIARIKAGFGAKIRANFGSKLKSIPGPKKPKIIKSSILKVLLLYAIALLKMKSLSDLLGILK